MKYAIEFISIHFFLHTSTCGDNFQENFELKENEIIVKLNKEIIGNFKETIKTINQSEFVNIETQTEKNPENTKNSWQEQKNEELEQKLKKIQQENEILTEKISEINKIFEEEKTELKNKIYDLNESIENAVEINSEETWNENILKVEINNNPMYINYQNSQPSTSKNQSSSSKSQKM
ncbi:hypothetical protein [Spiroplasma endosymbiont of Zeiraphera isertana]|uniref:hypothetical protein n=1 Tax=Spiroplasma endosymbiont of Zeiraphera isertana TaxID=3066313 RepID=UPI00313D1401